MALQTKKFYPNPTARPEIATPADATEELHTAMVNAYTAHFSGILSADLMISQRKACYATVINGTMNGKPLEQILGTKNAKIATQDILDNITAGISAVPPLS